ncbi:MAG: outer membrane protein assembly factor BamE domain-containing protein [Burkholderiales bacterium]
MKLRLTLILLFCIGLVGGCSTPRSLVVGQSTEADVRAQAGTPTGTWTDRDGNRVYEYATGPEGFITYLVRVGTDGKVREVTQVLTEDRLAKVVPGKTTKAEVRDLFGRPSFEHVYLVGPTWSWRFLFGGVRPGHIVVTFNPDDTVKDKIAIVDVTGEGRDK